MNKREIKLYNNLFYISASKIMEKAFYYVDQNVISINNPDKYQDWKYRIFGYKLATYTDFLQPDALWCRGTMFLINEKQEPQALVCLPMRKFFNINENPIAMVSDRILNEDITISEKRDGSLMSTYIDVDNNLKLKSKMSVKSEHCIKAMELLNTDKYKDLRSRLTEATINGFTVDLEWTSPDNKIVLGYDKDELMILSIQNKANITTIQKESLKGINLKNFFVKTFDKEVLNKNKDGIEGYVIEFQDGLRVKNKTDWYCLLHKNKEKIATDYNLYEICLNEAADDLISLFNGDDITINRIKQMQEKAKQDYFDLKGSCDAFYYCNKELDRKSYAIKGQKVLTNAEFGLAMSLYLGEEPNYIKILLKKFKEKNREIEINFE